MPQWEEIYRSASVFMSANQRSQVEPGTGGDGQSVLTVSRATRAWYWGWQSVCTYCLEGHSSLVLGVMVILHLLSRRPLEPGTGGDSHSVLTVSRATDGLLW